MCHYVLTRGVLKTDTCFEANRKLKWTKIYAFGIISRCTEYGLLRAVCAGCPVL
jgi:hypothetical protein